MCLVLNTCSTHVANVHWSLSKASTDFRCNASQADSHREHQSKQRKAVETLGTESVRDGVGSSAGRVLGMHGRVEVEG